MSYSPYDTSVAPWVLAGFEDSPGGRAAFESIYGTGATNTNPNPVSDPVLFGGANRWVAPPPAPVAATPAAVAAPAAAPTPSTTPAGTGRGGLSPTQQDAYERIRATLAQYGLASPEVLQWSQDQLVNGTTESSVMLDLYDPTTVPGKLVDQLYPDIRMRREAGQPPINIQTAVEYRRTIGQLQQAYGIPDGVFTPETIAKLSAGDVAPNEVKARLDDYTTAALQAPADTRQQLHELYGVGLGGLATYYMDPTRAEPILRQQFAAAQASAAAGRTGFGALNRSEAERLAALGYSPDQVQQGTSTLAQQSELFGALPGEPTGAITRDQQLAATFEGNAQAVQAIQRRQRQRTAQFGGAGSFGAGKEGISGLGSSGA